MIYGYKDAINELTMRERAEGGGLRPRVETASPQLPLGTSLVIFVHGYNVSMPKAQESYRYFLDTLFDLGIPEYNLASIRRLYWPGDKKNPLISKASYPWKIKTARQAGELLADYFDRTIARLPFTVSVTLVAHSLGCRLALETLLSLSHASTAGGGHRSAALSGILRRMKVCLMAAAVPTKKLDPRQPIRSAVNVTERQLILHSNRDKVLKGAFPIGETVAGDAFFPEAVGRHGKPTKAWRGNRIETGLDHSDYWSNRGTAYQVGRFLGLVVRNEISERGLLGGAQMPEYVISEYRPSEA